MATTQNPTVFDIKPGDIIALTDHKGREESVVVTRAHEHDSVMHLTDQTGWTHSVYPNTRFRYIHRAR